jgi:hypothetical protein
MVASITGVQSPLNFLLNQVEKHTWIKNRAVVRLYINCLQTCGFMTCLTSFYIMRNYSLIQLFLHIYIYIVCWSKLNHNFKLIRFLLDTQSSLPAFLHVCQWVTPVYPTRINSSCVMSTNNVSASGLHFRVQVEPTQFGPIDGASLCYHPILNKSR